MTEMTTIKYKSKRKNFIKVFITSLLKINKNKKWSVPTVFKFSWFDGKKKVLTTVNNLSCNWTYECNDLQSVILKKGVFTYKGFFVKFAISSSVFLNENLN